MEHDCNKILMEMRKKCLRFEEVMKVMCEKQEETNKQKEREVNQKNCERIK